MKSIWHHAKLFFSDFPHFLGRMFFDSLGFIVVVVVLIVLMIFLDWYI